MLYITVLTISRAKYTGITAQQKEIDYLNVFPVLLIIISNHLVIHTHEKRLLKGREEVKIPIKPNETHKKSSEFEN